MASALAPFADARHVPRRSPGACPGAADGDSDVDGTDAPCVPVDVDDTGTTLLGPADDEDDEDDEDDACADAWVPDATTPRGDPGAADELLLPPLLLLLLLLFGPGAESAPMALPCSRSAE
jgi:hypothetical protein